MISQIGRLQWGCWPGYVAWGACRCGGTQGLWRKGCKGGGWRGEEVKEEDELDEVRIAVRRDKVTRFGSIRIVA